MNDDVQPVLRQLVAQEGAALYADPRRCEALLKDLVGHRPAEVFVLVTAVEAGVPSALTMDGDAVEALAEKIHADYGLDTQAARWAVETWAGAMAGPAPVPSPVATASAPASALGPPPPSVDVPAAAPPPPPPPHASPPAPPPAPPAPPASPWEATPSPTPARRRRPLLLVAVAAVVVIGGVVVALLLTRGGGSSSGSSGPPSTFAFENEKPIAVPQSIGEFQLQPPTSPSSTVANRDLAAGVYLSTSTPRKILALEVSRAADVNRGPTQRAQEAQTLGTQLSDNVKQRFAPGSHQDTVTRGARQYTCLSGTTTESPPSTATMCHWVDGPIAYLILVSPQVAPDAAVDLGAQAEAGTQK